MSTDVAVAALLPESRAPAGARCANHAEREAASICARCGSFICRAETIVYDRKAWCPKCCELPDVEWLEIYRRSRVGKISGGVVMVPITSTIIFASAFTSLVLMLRQQDLARPILALGAVSAVVSALGLINSAFYVARWKPARILQAIAFAAALPGLLGAFVFLLKRPSDALGLFLVAALYVVGPMFALHVGVLASTRATLYFGGSVSRSKLIDDYRAYGNNPAASLATMLGMFALFVPLLCVPALMLARHAKRQVNLLGNPPVGREADADTALRFAKIGFFTTGLWALLAIWLFTRPG